MNIVAFVHTKNKVITDDTVLQTHCLIDANLHKDNSNVSFLCKRYLHSICWCYLETL